MTDPLSALKSAVSDGYAIEHELGAGGMATVYLAEDLKHRRKVAIKVLRPELAAVIGAERFLREIEIVAGLTHPHILPLHDSGKAVRRYGATAVDSQSEFVYYVMPYVEGESLRTRLDQERQLPIVEAVRITRQVASALEYAHGQEIVHRDIKPENILLHRGEVMVADFGIALAVTAAGGTRLTETGMSIGTPQYMSPEQASGDKHIDGRTDIYSLGCVLYEMLVGEAPYTGPSSQAIIAKVLTETPPPIRSARDTVSPAVEQVVFKALSKLAADRFGTAEQFGDALGDPGSAAVTVTAPVATEVRRSNWLAKARWAVTAVLAVIFVFLLWSRFDFTPGGSGGMRSFVVTVPADIRPNAARAAVSLSGLLAFDRDGSRLVMELDDNGILLRDMSDPQPRLLTGSAGEVRGFRTFFSPDGQWLAYGDFTESELRRVSIDGGSPVTIADDVPAVVGGTWGPQDRIVYAPAFSSGLWIVAVEGGIPEQLTFADTSAGLPANHSYPQFLPGWNKVLFTADRTFLDSARLEVLALETRERTTVIEKARFGRYAASGHILFMRHETLWAAPFDPDRLEVTGTPQVVMEDVAYSFGFASGAYAVSENGTLAYIKASVLNVERQLVWVDRNGNEQPLMEEWDRYATPAISPDGRRVAYTLDYPGQNDIWVYDLERGGVPTRVTRNEEATMFPRWTHDGERIAYSAFRVNSDVFLRDWQASMPAERVFSIGADNGPRAISPNGTMLITSVNRFEAGTSWDLWLVPLDGEGEPLVYRATEEGEWDPAFSPDGRWIAYTSTESGRREIWLQSYPDPARARYRVSNGGGWGAVWGPDGELFFTSPAGGRRMMGVRIDLESGAPGVPYMLFESGPYLIRSPRNYDVSADGQRFLVVKPRPNAAAREVTVVVNWFEELKRLVPNE